MMKKFKLPLVCLVLVVLALSLAACGGEEKAQAVGAVTVTIEYPDGTSASGAADIYEGNSYMDCTQTYCQSEKIPMVVTGTTYKTVESINNITSGEYRGYSENAGWVYYINGEMLMESASDVEAQDGDEILWQYADLSELDM